MGFFSGRVAFTRYRVTGRAPGLFDDKYLERLAAHAIGRQRVASADGVEVGWIAGDHILDTKFELAKNIVNDTLHFAFRIDSQRIPADLLRAYAQIELQALLGDKPDARPSLRQKRLARAAAKERLENEARDGRFLRRRACPVLWDGLSNELLVGPASGTALDRLRTHFHHTFDRNLEGLGAGPRAFLLAELREQTRGVDDASPSAFVPGLSPRELAWLPDQASRDFLGNEFLVWLWHAVETESDTLALGDGSEVAVMLARTLVLECPRGQTGRQSIRSDGPARLPEALRALQAGKLPRQAGLTLVRHDQQYELTLQAETLAVTGARLPPPEEEGERARLEERIERLRHLLETLDLLYDAFGRRRHGPEWNKELARIQKWLKRADQPPLAVTG